MPRTSRHPLTLRHCTGLFLTAMVAAYLAPAVSHAREDLRVVAVGAQSLPVVGDTLDFGSWRGIPDDNLHLNDNGQVAFAATMSFDDDSALFIESPNGGLRFLGIEGNAAAPFGPMATYQDISELSFNNSGQSVFSASVRQGDTSSESGVVRYDPAGNFEVLARTGNPAPGFASSIRISNVEELLYFGPRIDNSDNVLFTAYLEGDGIDFSNNSVLYRHRADGAFDMIVRAGDTVPFPELEATFTSFAGNSFFRYPATLNGSGDVVFGGGLRVASPSGNQFKHAVYRNVLGDEGGTELVAYSGQQAPGFDPGVTIDDFFDAIIDNQGRVTLSTQVDGITGPQAYYRTDSGGHLELLAYEGMPAPGLGPGVEIDSLPFVSSHRYIPLASRPTGIDFAVSDNGTLAFTAQVIGPEFSGSALYVEQEGELELLAVSSRNAPDDTPRLLSRDGSLFLNVFHNLKVNDFGQVVFGVGIVGETIYATDRNGELHIIAQLGDEIDLSGLPVSFSSASIVSFQNLASTFLGSEELKTDINNRGEIAFYAGLDSIDSPGFLPSLFVSNLVAVPEPATAGMVLPLLLALATRRRRYV